MGPFTLEKFAWGQSNPTYRLRAASGDYVLRRKPFGKLLSDQGLTDDPLFAALRAGSFRPDVPVNV